MLINSAYKEERWIHTYCHALSKQVIHFCLLQGCGKILTEVPGKLRRSGSEGADKPLIWVPSKFYGLLEYKARELGITTVKTIVRNASLRCSECGYIRKDYPKKQSEFVCFQCERKNPLSRKDCRHLHESLCSRICLSGRLSLSRWWYPGKHGNE